MKCRRIDVGPKLASALLKGNTANRRTVRALVGAFAVEMAAGRWHHADDTDDPIAFDADGVLVNGQHRLMAIVESGATVSVVVVLGAPDYWREQVKQGARRVPAHARRERRVTVDHAAVVATLDRLLS